MANLKEIPGIGDASLELLAVAGVRDAELLSQQDPDFLISEIKKAIKTLEIDGKAPSKSSLERWIEKAKELAEAEPTVLPKARGPVNYEDNEDVAELLISSPAAIPLPGKVMVEKKLKVSDVPEGVLLNRYAGKLDVRVDGSDRLKADLPERRDSGHSERLMTRDDPADFDGSQLKALIPDPNAKKRKTPKSKDSSETDRVGLIRAPLEKTNRGKNPESRRYVRGVLHTHPWRLRFGALFTLILILNIPLAIAAAFLLLLSGENPETFGWVPAWVIVFPLALPVIAFIYFLLGSSCKCRICTQKLFIRSVARKHIKSHRIPGFGFIVPLCLHLLVFNWFRCLACGTPVRLRK
ncbi:MAG: DUF4332 domain-containing protein [Akkermansiaceae bacterium]